MTQDQDKEGRTTLVGNKFVEPRPDKAPTGVPRTFGVIEARRIGEALGVRWETFDIAQFAAGMNVELEHGRKDPSTDITHDDPMMTGKIALAHLLEMDDYYTRLAVMESDAHRSRGGRSSHPLE